MNEAEVIQIYNRACEIARGMGLRLHMNARGQAYERFYLSTLDKQGVQENARTIRLNGNRRAELASTPWFNTPDEARAFMTALDWASRGNVTFIKGCIRKTISFEREKPAKLEVRRTRSENGRGRSTKASKKVRRKKRCAA